MTKITVAEGQIGTRIDKILSEIFEDFSRNKIQKHIKDGKVLVNGKIVKGSYKLEENDVVELVEEIVDEKYELKAEKIDLNVVFESDFCLVVEKPAGMVVHADESGGYVSGALVNAIYSKINVKSFGETLRPGIVHRLDKDTSGLMIVVKDKKYEEYFVNLFKEKKIRKFYQTLVRGKLEFSEGKIDAPIGRDRRQRKKMSILPHGGKVAITNYKVVEEIDLEENFVSLLDVEIETGRTHQIRVHLASISHPVVGDDVYGTRKINAYFKEKFGLERQFLHAYRLVFEDFDGKLVDLEIGLPEDLKEVMSQI